MGEICKYKEQVKYTEPFKGNIQTKRGSKYVESKIGNINGHDFIVTKDGLGIWIQMKKGQYQFNMPISQMYNVSKVKETVKGVEKIYIVYEMAKGLHLSATFGKKDKDGDRVFEPKDSCFNCANYKRKEGKSSYKKSSGSRSI